MIYDYLVKHNGKYYKPGEEVPENTETLHNRKPEASDEDIVMDTDAVVKPKQNTKRGRPKKSEQ